MNTIQRQAVRKLRINKHVQAVENLNDCQKAYRAALKKNMELLKKIERALIDQPAAANGNWGMVGTMKHIEEQLQSLSDQLNHEGEY